MRTVAVYLAAGLSARFRADGGGDKLVAPYRGKPLFRHGLDALLDSPEIDEVLVVVRPRSAMTTAPFPEIPRCRVVLNPDASAGMASSLRAGVLAAGPGASRYLVALADMPHMSPALVASLLRLHTEGGRRIALPFHDDRQGHPVVFDATLREELLGLEGDVGARGVIRRHPDEVARLQTDDPGALFDVDTPSDLTPTATRT